MKAGLFLPLNLFKKTQNSVLELQQGSIMLIVQLLRAVRAGTFARCDTKHNSQPNSKKLTKSEGGANIEYITELSTRLFPPRLHGVEEMANHLLRLRDAPPVGKDWASNFVQR